MRDGSELSGGKAKEDAQASSGARRGVEGRGGVRSAREVGRGRWTSLPGLAFYAYNHRDRKYDREGEHCRDLGVPLH